MGLSVWTGEDIELGNSKVHVYPSRFDMRRPALYRYTCAACVKIWLTKLDDGKKGIINTDTPRRRKG